jgi:hypothetical protein
MSPTTRGPSRIAGRFGKIHGERKEEKTGNKNHKKKEKGARGYRSRGYGFVTHIFLT